MKFHWISLAGKCFITFSDCKTLHVFPSSLLGCLKILALSEYTILHSPRFTVNFWKANKLGSWHRAYQLQMYCFNHRTSESNLFLRHLSRTTALESLPPLLRTEVGRRMEILSLSFSLLFGTPHLSWTGSIAGEWDPELWVYFHLPSLP